jgi:hypothetical protein
MNRNLKIFLLSGIPFGFLLGMWYSHLYGYQAGFKGGILSGVFFGFLTFLILGLLHNQAIKKITDEKSRETLGVSHIREIALQLSYDKSFDLCMKSLQLMKRYKIIEENRAQGRIIVITGINWKTWGDRILFEITKINNGHSQIKVSSRPNARTTLVDYGKNLENVEILISFLKNHSD